MTERLYYEDSYLKEFRAKVLKKIKIDNRSAVVLNETAFYPTSGGQPYDKGVIQDVPVVEVVEEGDEIIHILKEELKEKINSEIVGKIDWERRFDHMQQHLGQHILSGALMKLWGVETVSFHLGEEGCTLDIAKEKLTEEEAKKAEECANEIIFDNRPVKCYFVEGEEELKRLNLRKVPEKTEKIRIIEVENFDLSACGGTHCRATGEVGMIKIIKWEKRGEKIRLEFICGRRAWKDYFWKNELIKDISNKLTIKDSELGEAIDRMLEERKELWKELKEFKEKLQEYKAKRLIDESSLKDNRIKIINKVFEENNFQEVRGLVQKIINLDDSVVVLAGIKSKGEGEGAKILFACSRALKYDMNKLIREAGKFIEGRGGGAPNFAQAGGKKAEGIREALNFALEHLQEFIKK
ncbi:alanyl-tRNA editing protein [Candidatus Atribacteria bacterium HGW-Atribacteria-1]|nr:MAG: alanyl-tRNA editing protein [Candidatus Atribacteria bacterium HGW-Atribacteria-1]